MTPTDKSIQINNRLIGDNHPTYIIAEIGINHNGDLQTAKQLIDVAAEANVDTVKFQMRDLSSLYISDVLDHPEKYEQNFQYMIPILQEVELTHEDFHELKDHCRVNELEFLCTPFDIPSADFLAEMDVHAYKIASADLTNLELLRHVAAKGKPMIISTGMSFRYEIEQSVALLNRLKVPLALLHCRSVYPVWPREVNLKMINELRCFDCPVGYSGHDIGITIPLIAASMGASIIEKHITLDRTMRGPDHKISLEPYELKRLVRDIRVADQAMGRNGRFLLRGEILNRELFGKSLRAAVPIRCGSPIRRDMVKVQGPGKGLAPNRLEDLIGTIMQRDMKPGDAFLDEDVEGPVQLDFANTFKSRWGLISRFSDVDGMLIHQPKVIEFHLAEKDFHLGFAPLPHYSQELVVHCPEYIGDRLLDLCNEKPDVRAASIQTVQHSIDLARSLTSHFMGQPKVVVHPGAMSLNIKLDTDTLKAALIESLEVLDIQGIELLLENLPPYPWYFGGQWKGNYFMAAEEIRGFCDETGINICFDLSHAALYCNAQDEDLANFIRVVRPYIRHIHFADGYGLDGEGVQIGEGDVDFHRIMPLFAEYQGTWVPEIWRGHLQDGKGFLVALARLSEFDL